jgi:hypothetical protein
MASCARSSSVSLEVREKRRLEILRRSGDDTVASSDSSTERWRLGVVDVEFEVEVEVGECTDRRAA